MKHYGEFGFRLLWSAQSEIISAMQYCPECFSRRTPEESRYCFACGNELRAPAVPDRCWFCSDSTTTPNDGFVVVEMDKVQPVESSDELDGAYFQIKVKMPRCSTCRRFHTQSGKQKDLRQAMFTLMGLLLLGVLVLWITSWGSLMVMGALLVASLAAGIYARSVDVSVPSHINAMGHAFDHPQVRSLLTPA